MLCEGNSPFVGDCGNSVSFQVQGSSNPFLRWCFGSYKDSTTKCSQIGAWVIGGVVLLGKSRAEEEELDIVDEALFLLRTEDDDKAAARTSQQQADQDLMDKFLEGVLPVCARTVFASSKELMDTFLEGMLPGAHGQVPERRAAGVCLCLCAHTVFAAGKEPMDKFLKGVLPVCARTVFASGKELMDKFLKGELMDKFLKGVLPVYACTVFAAGKELMDKFLEGVLPGPLNIQPRSLFAPLEALQNSFGALYPPPKIIVPAGKRRRNGKGMGIARVLIVMSFMPPTGKRAIQ
eukprot:1159124-Pelagomonas_calceolata.AAC.1